MPVQLPVSPVQLEPEEASLEVAHHHTPLTYPSLRLARLPAAASTSCRVVVFNAREAGTAS